MKKVIAGMVAIAGLAAMANAAATITYQVRTVGGAWSSSVDVPSGTTVEFRCLVSHTGTAAAGIKNFNSQPQVSNWNSGTDTLQPFIAYSTNRTAPAPVVDANNRNGASLDLDAAYGRRYMPVIGGVAIENRYRGHTNLVSGVNYLRIAQFNTTAAPGTGSGANNSNGVGGVAINQLTPIGVVVGSWDEIDWPIPVSNGSGDGLPYYDAYSGPAGPHVPVWTPYPVNPAWGAPTSDGSGGFNDPNPNPDANSLVPFLAGTTNVEVYRFALIVGGIADRTLSVGTDANTMFGSPNGKKIEWYSAAGGTVTDNNPTIIPASIHVPTPGALALLGLGGLIAGRRRRA